MSAAMMKHLETVCRSHGMPLTIQRRAVLAALVRRTDHPTADDLFAVLRTTLPGISRPTVYRVLDSLVGVGVAKKVCHPGAAARFETRLDRHHHLVCVRCDRVMDFDHPALDRLSLPDAGAAGFELHDYSIHFQGVCPECARAKARRPARVTTVRPRRRAAKERR